MSSIPLQQRWFDDFAVGERFEFGAYTVTREEIVDFARRYDPQPFHLDEEAGRASHFGGLVASGWMTTAVLMRLLCDHFLPRQSSMGSPGVDEVRWLEPVRPGDTLRVRTEVLECRASRSKPDRGVLRCRHELVNQHGRVVATVLGMGMYRRRPPAA
ncbi:MAG: MaoC family dehydratase [Rubrivivax sp.]